MPRQTPNNEMQLTGGEGGAHAVLERRARVVIERRPQLISVLCIRNGAPANPNALQLQG